MSSLQSDHPAALDSQSRYLIYEAQQAFFYGLPYNLAIGSITSKAAEVLGLGHRLGYIRQGVNVSISHHRRT